RRTRDRADEVRAAALAQAREHPAVGGRQQKHEISLSAEAGFAERTAGPGELAPVPAGELRDCDAVLRRLDEPPVAEVDAHVVDLGRARPRSARAEEEDVRRLQVRKV